MERLLTDVKGGNRPTGQRRRNRPRNVAVCIIARWPNRFPQTNSRLSGVTIRLQIAWKRDNPNILFPGQYWTFAQFRRLTSRANIRFRTFRWEGQLAARWRCPPIAEALGAEVLSLGGFDMLAQLLDSQEVSRAVFAAGRAAAASRRILIVDDEERQRTALAAMLCEGDFETQVAADGQEALERLATFNADVIVTDLVMPRMDGFELLRHLKRRGALTPTIALTGFGSIEKALSAVHDLKAFWFLGKPVEPRAFKVLNEEPRHGRTGTAANDTGR
jgi:CheY-like chemotaxis protein